MSNLRLDFVGIGVPRSGTTWIYKCLKEHPEIYLSKDKEINLFGKVFDWEYCHKSFKHCREGQLRGEINPAYLSKPASARLIKEHNPEIKLIVSLRNPIERAHSYYCVRRDAGKELSQTFEEALEKETKGLIRDYSYIGDGYYYKNISRYLDFFRREQVLILIYEDAENNPLEFIQNIYKFLGVSEFSPPSLYKRINPTASDRLVVSWFNENAVGKVKDLLARNSFGKAFMGMLRFLKITGLIQPLLKKNRRRLEEVKKPKGRSPMNDKTRDYLREVYKNDIEGLEKLLNRDLSFWR